MKKLEDKILDKVYAYETHRTLTEFVVRIVLIVISGFLTVLFAWSILDIFFEQQTFALLQLFNEDIQTISKNIWDVMYVFYEETPKLTLVIFGALFFATLYGIIAFIKNFRRIIVRLKRIAAYWLRY